jgi:hypothetical protein
MAAEALEDLFLNTLLPPGRKLLNLDQRPLAVYEVSFQEDCLSPRVLLLWSIRRNPQREVPVIRRWLPGVNFA